KGTGKTSLPREIAARTKRPCVRIAHHRTTEPVELIGSMYPASNGGVEWKDGVLTAAIRRAGTIIILDEPTFCRAGVLALYQTL
ncbi:AAA family ATPase, partial [Escherichia coli]|nr:AAA family ATPase [Escherichia coli]